MTIDTMISAYTYEASSPGPHILLTGGVHGNEPCGVFAIEKLRDMLEQRQLVLQRGSVTLIPICNPRAYAQSVRCTETNLARIFASDGESYEEQLAAQIKPYIEAADMIVDIHSLSADGDPFVLQDYDDERWSVLARATGMPMIIGGRPQLYEESNQIDITGYAYLHDIPSVVVECGQHDDPVSKDVARDVVQNVLHHYEMLEGAEATPSHDAQYLHMYTLVYKESVGSWTQPWQHGQHIPAGTVIVEYENGDNIIAEQESYMVLPHAWAEIGDERFYLAYERQIG